MADHPEEVSGLSFTRVAAFAQRFRGYPLETANVGENTKVVQTARYRNVWYMSAGSVTEGNSGGGDFVDNPATGRPEVFAVISRSMAATPMDCRLVNRISMFIQLSRDLARN